MTPTTLVYGTGGLAFGEAILNASYFSPLLKPVLNFGVGANGLSRLCRHASWLDGWRRR